MSDSDKVLIREKDINLKLSGDRVGIESNGLVNALIHRQDAAINLLKKQIAPIRVADISIAENGKVVVDNAGFKSALKKKISDPSNKDMLNIGCGLGC